jgi:hypothetical protein
MSAPEFKFDCFHCDQPLKCDPATLAGKFNVLPASISSAFPILRPEPASPTSSHNPATLGTRICRKARSAEYSVGFNASQFDRQARAGVAQQAQPGMPAEWKVDF